MTHQREMPNWIKPYGVAVFFGLLVVVMTLPAVFHLSDRLIGNSIDNWIFYWNDWWLREALSTGAPLLRTPYLFHPIGASLAAHSNSFGSSLLALLFTPVAGPVAGYNLAILVGLWIGCMGMFYFVRELTGSAAAALVAAWIFTFAPYRVTQVLAHAHLGSVHWWPILALFLHRTLRRGRWYDAVFAGVAFALTLWTGLQLAVMAATWGTLYGVHWTVSASLVPPGAIEPRGRLRKMGQKITARLPLLALMAVVACLLTAPVLIPIVREWRPAWTEGFDLGSRDQTDLLAYVIPPTYSPLIGPSVVNIYERFTANRAYMPYLGLGAVILALLGRPRRRRDVATFWLLTLVLWLVLAAGSSLRFNDVIYPHIRLPYRWLADVFPFSTLRAPDRFNLLGVFTLAVLAGYGVKRMRQRAWLLPLGLLMIVEYLPVPLLEWNLLPPSSFYTEMRQDQDDYAVIDYPMGYNQAKLWLYYQTLHGKPTVEGHISRYTPDLYAYLTSNPLLKALYKPSISTRPTLLPAAPFEQQVVPVPALGPAIRDLTDNGVRYLLVHTPYLDANTAPHLRRLLPLAPSYEDDTLTVYDLDAPTLIARDGLPSPLSPAATLARFDVEQGMGKGTWQAKIVAGATAPDVTPLPCEILLSSQQHRDVAGEFMRGGDGDVVARAPVTLFPPFDVPMAWQAGDLDYQIVELAPPQLPAGRYAWSLACDGAAYSPPEVLTIDATGAGSYRRRDAGVVYNGDIRLAGYRWQVEGAELALALWWQALAPIDQEWVVFVHLLDGDGTIVSQYDAIPCAWTCPTQGWQPGQTVADHATLELGALPAGTYHLALGLYAPQSMQRAAAAAGNTMYEDGYVLLPDPLTLTHLPE